MRFATILAFILVIVGALNWFLIGLFDFNLVSAIFGSLTFMSRSIYTLVGLASLWLVFFLLYYKPIRTIKN